MSIASRRIRVYAKCALVVAAVLAIGLVAFKNRANNVNVWFFRTYKNINVLWLMWFTAVGSIAAFRIICAGVATVRELRGLHGRGAEDDTRSRQDRAADKLEKRRALLDEREK